jgi:hypothetical protein
MGVHTLSGTPLTQGKTTIVMSEQPIAAGAVTKSFSLDADSAYISLFVSSIALGASLTLAVRTITEDGKEFPVVTFPTVTSPSVELLIRKAVPALSILKLQATFTGACEFDVRARGIGTGETSVKILGASDGRAAAITATTTPTPLFPTSLADRSGLIVRNNSNTTILYIGFSIAEATTANGYPLGPQESLGIDLGAGETIYGTAESGSIDVRTIEAGA